MRFGCGYMNPSFLEPAMCWHDRIILLSVEGTKKCMTIMGHSYPNVSNGSYKA